jgi:hypothetical protein
MKLSELGVCVRGGWWIVGGGGGAEVCESITSNHLTRNPFSYLFTIGCLSVKRHPETFLSLCPLNCYSLSVCASPSYPFLWAEQHKAMLSLNIRFAYAPPQQQDFQFDGLESRRWWRC